MKKITLLLLCIPALLCSQLSQAQTTPAGSTLKLGDPAPPLVVEKWVKGKPVDLNDGKVHVIELWATWCGPCKFGMPHLSNLAKKYRGQVEFAGISILENGNDYLPEVESYARHANESMDYNVAAGGGKDATMADTYLHAVGSSGIPFAFVIDRQGKLAWFGHPLIGLDKALALAVEDKLSIAAAERINKQIEELKPLGNKWRNTFLAARGAGDDKTVLELADEIVDSLPHMGAMVIPYQYVALVNTDPAGAAKFEKKLLTEYYNAPMILRPVANMVLDEKSRISGKRDYAFAVKLLKQTEKMIKADADLKALLAKALFHVGNTKEAIKEQKRALALAKEELITAEKQSAVASDEYSRETLDRARKKVESVQSTLDEYQR
jgi:thiol-disulfide isomerase/thioredoxin